MKKIIIFLFCFFSLFGLNQTYADLNGVFTYGDNNQYTLDIQGPNIDFGDGVILNIGNYTVLSGFCVSVNRFDCSFNMSNGVQYFTYYSGDILYYYQSNTPFNYLFNTFVQRDDLGTIEIIFDNTFANKCYDGTFNCYAYDGTGQYPINATGYFMNKINGIYSLSGVTPTEICYIQPIKESILKVGTIVTSGINGDNTIYSFTNNGNLDLNLILETGLNDFTEQNIVNELGIRGFDTVLSTFDRDISLELPIINGTYEMFLGNATNITGIKTKLGVVYNYDFELGKVTFPGNVGKITLDGTFLISPYSEQFLLFKNTSDGTQFCFDTTDSTIINEIQLIQLQEEQGIISTDDMVYKIQLIIDNNNIVPDNNGTVVFESNNVVPTIQGVGYFDFLLNPLKETLESTSYKFITDLILLNELPAEVDGKINFNLIRPVINSDWTFDIDIVEVEMDFITDKMGISNIERNQGVVAFISFFLALMYIMGKVVFIFILLAPIFFILWIFQKFSMIFDLSKHSTGNLVSIPFYLTYLTAFFVTIGTFTLLIGSFYDFILIVSSYITHVFVWISGSLGDYQYFRNVVVVFYLGIGGTLSTFIIYRVLNKFAKVN